MRWRLYTYAQQKHNSKELLVAKEKNGVEDDAQGRISKMNLGNIEPLSL